MSCPHCSHCNPLPFKHGARVLLQPVEGLRRPGPTMVGVVTSYPRMNTRLVHVKWPDGWAGWCHIDELKAAP